MKIKLFFFIALVIGAVNIHASEIDENIISPMEVKGIAVFEASDEPLSLDNLEDEEL